MSSTSDASLRVFWPGDIPAVQRSGVIVGWKNQEADINVVGVLEDVTARSVENALQTRVLLRNSPNSLEEIFQRCGNLRLQVLGTVYFQPLLPDGERFLDPIIADAKSLVVIYENGRNPRFHCPLSLAVTMQVIIFRRPDPRRMQYLSLSPISLTLTGPPGLAAEPVPSAFNIDKETESESKRKMKLVDKLRLHTVIKHTKTPKELALGTIIDQINCSFELNKLLQSNIGLVGVRRKRTLSVKELVVESATNFWDGAQKSTETAFHTYIWPTLYQCFLVMLIACRAVAEILLQILDWRILPRSTALKDVFATAQQIDIRLQQFCYWPSQYVTLSRRRRNWDSITNNHAEYIRFYNSLWLVANDVIIGIAVGSYIIDNADHVAHSVTTIVDSWFLLGLQRVISWLMDWPAGLKLNNELAAFLGDLFLWVIEYWAGCMQAVRPHLPRIIRIVGYSSFAGASMPISMSSDLVSLFTLHIHSFYIASARIYNWQLTIIVSLFHLFRGKKRNVLRNRIDSCDYDLDQLLLGTILFTLLTFLLPTVAVFYATFAGARTGIILGKACLDLWLACLNHFPLFALMLRIKDSRRLPGGIRFELQQHDDSSFASAYFRGGREWLLSWVQGSQAQGSSSAATIGQSAFAATAETGAMSTAPTGPKTRTADAMTGDSKTEDADARTEAAKAPRTATMASIRLKSIPLSLGQTFQQYAHLADRIKNHYCSPRVLACLLTGQFIPPIHRKSLYSLQYGMLPAQRVGVLDLWKLLSR